MPSTLTHAAFGLISKNVTIKKMSLPFWLLSTFAYPSGSGCIGFRFGITYNHFLGHRGFFHSLFFALLVGVVYAFIYLRKNQTTWKTRFLFIAYFFLLTASNGLLDIFTNGGMGVALLSPFDTTRYFFLGDRFRFHQLVLGGFFGLRGWSALKVNLYGYGCLLYLFCYYNHCSILSCQEKSSPRRLNLFIRDIYL